MRDSESFARLSITLLIICAISAFALSMLNGVTAPVIADNREAASNATIKEILATSDTISENAEIASDDAILASIQEDNPDITSYKTVSDNGAVVAHVFSALSNGYGGKMENTMVFDNEGNIIGFRNLTNAETPGFGDKITFPEYYERYNGKSIANSEKMELSSGGGENQVEAITGSTISSKGVLDGVNKMVDAFHKHVNN